MAELQPATRDPGAERRRNAQGNSAVPLQPICQSHGVGALATDAGAEDCVTEGRDGLIVPARDVDRTAQAILSCSQNREATRVMGGAARAKVESQFTLAHYDQHMIALYREVARGSRVA